MITLPPCNVLQDSEPVTALAYSPDGSRIYTASRSLQQRAWDVESARVLRTWKVGTQQDSFKHARGDVQTATQRPKRQEHLGRIWTQHELKYAQIYKGTARLWRHTGCKPLQPTANIENLFAMQSDVLIADHYCL